MRKRFLAAACLLAAFAAPSAYGDSLTDPNGILIYPDGSVITSYTYVAGSDGYSSISFEFSGGYGSAYNLLMMGAGEFGSIVFTEPVSNVSVSWEDSYGLYMNFYSFDYGELGAFTEPVCATYSLTPCSGTLGFANPGLFEMTWTTNQLGYTVSGYGGISSLSYTVVPEPGTAVLLLTGIAWLGLVLRKRVAFSACRSPRHAK